MHDSPDIENSRNRVKIVKWYRTGRKCTAHKMVIANWYNTRTHTYTHTYTQTYTRTYTRSYVHGCCTYVRTWLLYVRTWLFISMLWHRQRVFESKGDKLSSSAECRIRNRRLWNRISNRWQTDWAIEYQTKNLNSIAVPMISEHSAHCRSAFAPGCGGIHLCCC